MDEIEEQHILVYEYFRDNLLSFIKRNADLPTKARKFILREIGLANRDLNAKNWIHLGKAVNDRSAFANPPQISNLTMSCLTGIVTPTANIASDEWS